MTLGVAWKFQNKVCLATDSCITIGDTHDKFGGIKVLSIPVKIIGAIDAQNGSHTVYYEHSIGMCFAGSFWSSYIAKELLCEVFSNLQIIDSSDEISFERIAKFGFRFYENSFERLRNTIKAGFDADFIIAGFCQSAQRVRAFLFYTDTVEERPALKEILHGNQDHEYYAIGSGADKFKNLYEGDLSKGEVRVHFQIPKRIKTVIDDKSIPSVDGVVQYGDFNTNNDFILYGVCVPQENKLWQHNFYLRGTELTREQMEGMEEGFILSYRFMLPFEKGH